MAGRVHFFSFLLFPPQFVLSLSDGSSASRSVNLLAVCAPRPLYSLGVAELTWEKEGLVREVEVEVEVEEEEVEVEVEEEEEERSGMRFWTFVPQKRLIYFNDETEPNISFREILVIKYQYNKCFKMENGISSLPHHCLL